MKVYQRCQRVSHHRVGHTVDAGPIARDAKVPLLDGFVVFDIPEADEIHSPGSTGLVVHRNTRVTERAKRTKAVRFSEH